MRLITLNGWQIDNRQIDDDNDHEQVQDDNVNRNWDLFNWGYMFNIMIPQTFIFPECNVSDLFKLWFYGNQHYNDNGNVFRIQPYKNLVNCPRAISNDNSPHNTDRFSHAKCLMAYLIKSLIDNREGYAHDFMHVLFPANENVTDTLISMRIASCRDRVLIDTLYQRWWDHCKVECQIPSERSNTMCFSAVYKHHVVKHSPYMRRRNRHHGG